MPASDIELSERVKTLAREFGFERAGIARAEPLGPEAERLNAWLEAGYHGTMEYMQRTAPVRVDPGHPGMLLGARSVVVLVAPYAAAQAQAPSDGAPGRVARYAQGRDYHDVLHKRARGVARMLRDAGHATRAAVDSMPVFERAWAQRAGVGFIGKNCCLIVPGLGSHVFLAALVTTAELRADQPMRERCGECRLCLDACPTRAFVEPRRMDARRCISYLTIEHRGAIDEQLRPQMGDWIFGCDACQDVCPFNRTSPPTASVVRAFTPDERFAQVSAETFLELDDAAFAELARGTALRRTKREGMARNAAIALGNRGDRRVLPVLVRCAEADPSPVVRESARWAIARVEERG